MKDPLKVDTHLDLAAAQDIRGRSARLRESYGLPPLDVQPTEDVPEPAPVEAKPEPPRHSPAWYSSDEKEMGVAVADEAVRLGIDPLNDEQLVALAQGQKWESLASFYRAAGEHLEKRRGRQEKQSSITLGAVVSEASTTPSVSSAEDLADELSRIQNGPDPTSPANAARRKAIREELRRQR
jgi:hypothetical protein